MQQTRHQQSQIERGESKPMTETSQLRLTISPLLQGSSVMLIGLQNARSLDLENQVAQLLQSRLPTFFLEGKIAAHAAQDY